jgi:hypothetical protein|tara:strand:+ start:26496 stop:26921 length:426 start_codon:yes stop_codon:yes gene_type:complete
MHDTILRLKKLSVEAHHNPALITKHTKMGVITQMQKLLDEYYEISKGALSISDFELSDSTSAICNTLKKAIGRYNNLNFLSSLGKSPISLKIKSAGENITGMLISYSPLEHDHFNIVIQSSNGTQTYNLAPHEITSLHCLN